MSVKIMLNVKGELFDLWDFRTIQRGERYNDIREEMDYLLLINKNAIATNYNDLEIAFDTVEERETALKAIKTTLDDSDNVLII